MMEIATGIMTGGMSLLASASTAMRCSPVLSTGTVHLTSGAQTSTAGSLTTTKLSRVRRAQGVRTHSARTYCLATDAALTSAES